jgi:hypothetical protein
MVVAHHLSIYSHFCSLQHPFKASTVAQLFMDNIFKIHDMPQSIVTDHDPTLTSNLWQELFHLQGTKLNLMTSYQPHNYGSK